MFTSINTVAVYVSDMERAKKFYTEILGFVKRHDVPVGEYRWITVVSPDDLDGTELLLEPNANAVAKTYQQGLFEQGIAAASFGVDNVDAEYGRLRALGVTFAMAPTQMDDVALAVFDDTCGNLIQIVQAYGD